VLTIRGNRLQPFCDQLARRDFLRIGSLGLGSLATGGLTLPELLCAESLSNSASSGKSIIMVYLPGGPTQHETFDPKPEAPEEIRGAYTAQSALAFPAPSSASCCPSCPRSRIAFRSCER